MNSAFDATIYAAQLPTIKLTNEWINLVCVELSSFPCSLQLNPPHSQVLSLVYCNLVPSLPYIPVHNLLNSRPRNLHISQVVNHQLNRSRSHRHNLVNSRPRNLHISQVVNHRLNR